MSFFSRKKNHAPPPQNNAQQQPSAPPTGPPQVVQRQIVKEPSYERYSFSLLCILAWQRLPVPAYPPLVIDPHTSFTAASTAEAAPPSHPNPLSSTLPNLDRSPEAAVPTPLPATARRNPAQRRPNCRRRTTNSLRGSSNSNRQPAGVSVSKARPVFQPSMSPPLT